MCANYCSPASYRRRASFRSASKTDHDQEQSRQCRHLRDIFGDPFRPISALPTWLTVDVIELARTIYDERAFDRLPELADALEQAGCTHADLLAHLCQPEEHVRGCWAVDLLLGEE
ncbi:MAG: hypothetical protein L0Y72_20025 [Gemmataceae bacterium]|nr:hypothetical protein [Gemmataceae bacterium]MCI0741325.1 hypothetical protein [Gemmataceae bacterium]